MASKVIKNIKDSDRKIDRKKRGTSWKFVFYYILGALTGIGVYMLQNM